MKICTVYRHMVIHTRHAVDSYAGNVALPHTLIGKAYVCPSLFFFFFFVGDWLYHKPHVKVHESVVDSFNVVEAIIYDLHVCVCVNDTC